MTRIRTIALFIVVRSFSRYQREYSTTKIGRYLLCGFIL